MGEARRTSRAKKLKACPPDGDTVTIAAPSPKLGPASETMNSILARPGISLIAETVAPVAVTVAFGVAAAHSTAMCAGAAIDAKGSSSQRLERTMCMRIRFSIERRSSPHKARRCNIKSCPDGSTF